jgi:glycine/D-amino acid oxidase-like deaminating enzyme
MTQTADVVIIGAGAFGASTTYYLTEMGQRVTLVDRYEPVSQTSPRAAGLTGHIRGTDEQTRLATYSIETIERFTELTGEPLIYEQPGSLKIARRPQDVEQLHEEVARGQRLGLERMTRRRGGGSTPSCAPTASWPSATPVGCLSGAGPDPAVVPRR